MMIARLARNFNGITVAYVMGMVNSLLSLLLAFGVHLTLDERASITAFVNAALIVVAHVGHRVGEAQAASTRPPPNTA